MAEAAGHPWNLGGDGQVLEPGWNQEGQTLTAAQASEGGRVPIDDASTAPTLAAADAVLGGELGRSDRRTRSMPAVVANALMGAGSIVLGFAIVVALVTLWANLSGRVALLSIAATAPLALGIAALAVRRRRRSVGAHLIGDQPASGTTTTLDGEPGMPTMGWSREQMVERLRGRTSGVDRNGMALLFLRLDGIERINRSLGRSTGDQVLHQIARRLDERSEEGDLVGRVSASVFVVAHDRAVGSSAWAHDLLAVLTDPVAAAGQQLRLTGAGTLVTTDGFHVDADALLEDAERLVRPGLAQQRGPLECVHLHFDEHRHDRPAHAALLIAALDRGEIVADYQPILDLRTMEVVGVEALARWRTAPSEVAAPDDFLEIARAVGVDGAILDRVLEQVGRDFAAGPARERGWWVSVNLSVEDCTDPTLPGRLEAVLADTALDPDRLVLEVSERAVPVAEVERSLGTLAEIGVRLAIDDFGSGWSSLAQLRSLPISLLKLDRSLVSQPTTADAQLTLATVAMAQALGMETLAEGVEEGEDLLLLCLAECNYGQGFWWSDAQPLDVVLDRFPPLTDPMELYAPVFDLHALRKEFDQSDGWPSDEGILDELESELRALREDDASTIEMPDAMDDEVSHVDAGDPCTSGNDEVESVDVGARSTSPATVSPAAQPWDEGEVDAPARRGTAASQPGAVERELIAALRDRGDDAGTDCPPIVEHVATEPLRDDAWLDLSDDDFLDRLRSRTAAVGSPTGPELAP